MTTICVSKQPSHASQSSNMYSSSHAVARRDANDYLQQPPPAYEYQDAMATSYRVQTSSSQHFNQVAQAPLMHPDVRTPAHQSSSLQAPVVIPQRRPGSKERGFILAYPPDLEKFGIDQVAFLGFLQGCNKAVQGNAALAAVQVAGFGVSCAPELISTIVGTAVQYGAGYANSKATQWKTNTFMDKYNEELFAPNGLLCLPMVYDPNIEESYDQQSDARSGIAQRFQNFQGAGAMASKLHKPYQRIDSSRLPDQIAPLIYIPGEVKSREEKQQASKGQRVKDAWHNFNTYLDKRAQVSYATKNGNVISSALPTSDKTFSNRYLDPNHAAVNNGLIGLLSGGHIKRSKGSERSRSEDANRGRPSSEQHSNENEEKPKKKKIMYLTIVELPRAAMRATGASSLPDLSIV